VETNRQDFIVGLLIVVAVGLVIGALLATSGWGQRRYALYMRVANAEGISADTRVLVEGLEIGRVASIVPRVDPTSRRVSFIARLSLAQEFENGSKLLLPLGTKASIAPVSQISSASEIVLLLPDSTHGSVRMLGAGDTINSDRPASALDSLKVVVTNLSSDVHQVLLQTERTLTGVQHTLTLASSTIQNVQPGLLATVASVSASMARIDSMTQRIPRGIADSVTATLASSNRLLLQLDSLTRDVRTVTSENRGDLRTTAANLAEVSRQLNHFADAVSRRPYRFLTGVTPLPPESTKADPPKDSVKP
jgi:ABC-type transporter Mla subunit MlaD